MRRTGGVTWDNDLIAKLFEQNELGNFRREFPVHNPLTGRLWKIDFSWNWPPIKQKGGITEHAWPVGNRLPVAVEYQGGLTVGGWHLGVARYAGDCRKMRWLSAHGWIVMPFTVLDMDKPALVIAEIKQALELPNDFERLSKIGL